MESAKAGTIPEWASRTPSEDSYALVMLNGGGGVSERVEMSRAEYIALKRQLAMMRGFSESALPAEGPEQHYTPKQLAQLWGLSEQTIRRRFYDEPGVLKIQTPRLIGRKRRDYVSLRIPASVAARWHERNSGTWLDVPSGKGGK